MSNQYGYPPSVLMPKEASRADSNKNIFFISLFLAVISLAGPAPVRWCHRATTISMDGAQPMCKLEKGYHVG